MNHTVRPIGTYPGIETPATMRRVSPFRTSWSKIKTLLERELRQLGATEYILELDVREWDLRQDGGLRANARPQGPRIVVAAETKHGPIVVPCDTFRSHEDNLYAIALSLEKLRAVDRYGVAMRGEQYRGWTAIPASTGGLVSIDSAWALLAREAGIEPQARDAQSARALYIRAAKHCHPDAGGSSERFTAIGKARDLILGSLES